MKYEDITKLESVNSSRDPVRRLLRAVRKLPSKTVKPNARTLLYTFAAYLALGRDVGQDEFRVAASELAEATDMSERSVVTARAELEARGLIVITHAYHRGKHIPPTYRVDVEAVENLCTQAQSVRSSRRTKQVVVKPGLQDVQTTETNSVCTSCTPRSAPVADGGLHQLQSQVVLRSPTWNLIPTESNCAADAAPPSGRVSQTEGDQTEEAEPDTAPSLHLAAQQSAPAPSGKNQAGRLSAGDSSAWIPEEVPTPGSGVRKKKGKKRSVEPSRSEAPSAALAAPPARPETSPQSPAREAPPVAPVALPDRTREATPRAAPVPVPGDAHPRTPPEHPLRTLTRAIPLVWSGDVSGSAHSMTDTDAEKGFLARYRAAEKAVRYAAIGFQTECLEGEALATFCARTFAAHFPRGYSVELAEFLDSRTRTLKAAHALHESREQARRERAAAEAAREEELAKRAKDAETATRAHKKKRSA